MKINEIRKLEGEIRRLKKLVYYDELTDILNRRGFKEEAEKIFGDIYPDGRKGSEKRVAPKLPFSVIFIDLDNFKKVNDKYGHDAGDMVLKNTAKTLKHHLRKNDIYARWGGEEFVVALPKITEPIAEKIAEKLRQKIETREVNIGKNRKIRITISIGIVMHHNENTLSGMIENADMAMYKAKKKGKNRAEMFKHG